MGWGGGGGGGGGGEKLLEQMEGKFSAVGTGRLAGRITVNDSGCKLTVVRSDCSDNR